MTTKYPLHSQYLRLIDAQQAILNNLKNKSTPLIVNDSYVPPINYTRTDLPWTLGSKAHPWRNLYISNKSASDLSSTRSEVIDVYAKLSNIITTVELNALEQRIESLYATKTYVDAGDNRVASEDKVGGFTVPTADHKLYAYNYVETGSTVDDVYSDKQENGKLVTVEEVTTNISYWDVLPTLRLASNKKYTGTDFSFEKVSEKFPGVYKEELNDKYVLVYNNITPCVYLNQSKDVLKNGALYIQGSSAYAYLPWGGIQGELTDQVDLVNFVNSSVQTATAFFCGNWDTWDAIPTTVAGFTDLGLNAPNINNYLVVNADSSHSHSGERWRYKYDQKVTTKLPYDKNHWIPEYKVNDRPFTAAEQAALASGITAGKVNTYDNYATTKVGKTDYATTSTAGIVKVDGSTISVTSDGTLSAIGGGDVKVELGVDLTWVTSTSGRRFARNDENTGTIMEWNDNGTTRWTVVFDAKYRSTKQLYSDFTTNLGLSTFTNIGNTIPSAAASGSDTVLNANNNFNQDARGNTPATTEWMSKPGVASYADGAIYYARSLTSLNPTGVDLPTINCLSRIYNDRVILDSMDPTVSVSSYNKYALTSWTFDSITNIWAASWYGDFSGYYCSLLITNGGKVSGNNQNMKYGIIPVLDIPNPEA